MRTNESRVTVKFLRENIFTIYRIPQSIISGQGTHFDNRSFDALLKGISSFTTLQPLMTTKQMVK